MKTVFNAANKRTARPEDVETAIRMIDRGIHGHTLAQFMLDNNVDPKTNIRDGYNFVTYAVAANNYLALPSLAAIGGRLDAKDPAGRHPLKVAMDSTKTARGLTFATLLPANKYNAYLKVVIERIADQRDTALAEKIREAGVYKDTYDKDLNTGFLRALKQACHGVASEFAEAGANLLAVNRQKKTALDFLNQYPFKPLHDKVVKAAAAAAVNKPRIAKKVL